MTNWMSVEEREPFDGDEAWVYHEERRGMRVARARYNEWLGWIQDGEDGELLTGVTHYQLIVKPTPPHPLFVGPTPEIGATLKIGETCMGTPQSDSTQPHLVVEYDTAAMDG